MNPDFDHFVFTPRVQRRGALFVGLCAAIVGTVLATTLLHAGGSASAASGGPPAILTPNDGVYLGAFSGPRAGETRQQAFTRVEQELGRDLAIDHEYYKWDSAFPTSQETWAVSHGSIPFINWKAERSDGSVVRWSTIASGSQDAAIAAKADALKAFGSPVYLTFHHEPENDLATWGTPSEYAAAFRHVVDVFRSRGVTNVGFVWDMMTWTFDSRSGRDQMAFYPGDDYVDFIGADGYNWYPSKPSWDSFQTVFSDTNAWAVARNKPWMVVETGVQEDPNVAGRKGDWFRGVLATAEGWPALKAFIYFDVAKAEDGTIHYWQSDSSSSSAQGFAALGATSYFEPGGSGPGPSPSPSPGPSPSPTPGPSPSPSPTPSPSPWPLKESFNKGKNGAPVAKGRHNHLDAVVVKGGSSLVYDDTHAVGGTGLSAKHEAGRRGSAGYAWRQSFGTHRRWFGRVYLYLESLPHGVIRLVSARAHGELRTAIDLSASGRIAVKDKAGRRIARMGTTIATGGWVRIEWHIDQRDRQVEVRLFNDANSTSPTATIITSSREKIGYRTDDVRIGQTRRIRFSTVFWTDDAGVARDDFLGPA